MKNFYEHSYEQAAKSWNFKTNRTYVYIENNATNMYLTVGEDGTVFEATPNDDNNTKQLWLKGQSKLGEFLENNEIIK